MIEQLAFSHLFAEADEPQRAALDCHRGALPLYFNQLPAVASEWHATMDAMANGRM